MGYLEPSFLPWDGRRVPITFVGGYLGAGKTTAINELLAYAECPIAVIVNDVGSINIDARLIRRRHGDTIELTNGCVCCSSIDEVGAAFDMIRARPQPPDHVVVELSGVAEPHKMLPWGNTAGFRLDGIVVVVAADQLTSVDLPGWITGHLHDQIAVADLLVLTKTDLVDEAAQATARAALAALAPSTPVFDGGRDRVGPGTVGRFLAVGGGRRTVVESVRPSLFDGHTTATEPFPAACTSDDLRHWLTGLPLRNAHEVVRAKGVATTTDAGQVLVQVVGRRIEVTPLPPAEVQPSTDLVVITICR